MFDRRIKYASDYSGKRLTHVEEASPIDDVDADEKLNRRSRKRYARLLNYARYPSYRVRGIYGIIILVVFYTTIVPALVNLSNKHTLPDQIAGSGAGAGVGYGVGAGLDSTLESPKAKADGSKMRPAGAGGGRSRAPGEHKIDNGRLIVDAMSKIHPIHQLIRDARSNWDEKVARQSKTLKQAEQEYRRRYRRPPPAGFDKWWAYVVKHNVQLPDEYDLINKDLQLFWGVSPRDLRRRIDKATKEKDTFTFKVKDGKLTATTFYKPESIHDDRLEGQLEIMDEIVQYLPDMNVVYSVHDTPRTVISWQHRQELLTSIEERDYISESEDVAGTFHGWAATCPYSTPMNKRGRKETGIPPFTIEHKSFIWDHSADMDICQHPQMIPLHGLLAGKDHYVKELGAMFSLSKTSLHTDILGVPTERVVSDVALVPWKEKTRGHLLWRGANTAMHYGKNIPWQQSQRVRLIELTNSEEGEATVLAAPGSMGGRNVLKSAATTSNAELNERYMDTGFVGKAMQCEIEDGTCDEISNNYAFRPRVAPKDFDHAKYLLDMDGNAWSARFQRLMMSGSLVFKSTALPEWWNERVQPWVHYVPVKLDYTDLYDSLAFFAGDMDGKGGADDLAQQIARAGRDWSMSYYRHEDMVAYVFRLYLEWARLQRTERSAGAFKYDPKMEVGDRQ